MGWFILFIVLWAGEAGATVWNAANCNQSTIQTLINSGSTVDGDTIAVPAGTCTWTQRITITNKALTLQGAGGASTHIIDGTDYNASPSTAGLLYWTTKATGGIHRITGFWFDGNSVMADDGGNAGSIHIQGNTASFRFDHNIADIWRTSLMYFFDFVRGVMDHNTITMRRTGFWFYVLHGYWNNNHNGCGLAGAFVVSNGCADSSWASVSTMGMAGSGAALYTEDNTITKTNGPFYVNDGWAGMRAVSRFNTIIDGVNNDHGYESSSRSGGMRHFEQYRNAFSYPSLVTPALFGLRGGTGMFFDNYATYTYSGSNPSGGLVYSSVDMVNYGSPQTPDAGFRGFFGACDGTNAWDQNSDGFGYRCLGQAGAGQGGLIGSGATPTPAWPNQVVEPIYAWYNRRSGAFGVENLPANPITTTIIHANRDFYDYTASFNGTSGVGRGLRSARPATCTTGVAYWSTNGGGNWNAGSSTDAQYNPTLVSGEDGGLDKCISTNNWQNDWYVPYTYPHPLIGGGGPDTTPPAAPTGVTIISLGLIALMWGLYGHLYSNHVSHHRLPDRPLVVMPTNPRPVGPIRQAAQPHSPHDSPTGRSL